MRVLIADGDKDGGNSLAALVQRCGHEVLLVVGSGLEAIQGYSRLQPDVLIMDYALPRLNGFTAGRMILAKHPGARIVLVTTTAPVAQLAASGAVAILVKPVEFDKLYGALYAAAPDRNSGSRRDK